MEEKSRCDGTNGGKPGGAKPANTPPGGGTDEALETWLKLGGAWALVGGLPGAVWFDAAVATPIETALLRRPPTFPATTKLLKVFNPESSEEPSPPSDGT